jgi:RNA polymerase sigma factor (sigma-70 family)
MVNERTDPVLRCVWRLFEDSLESGLPDSQLLKHFASHRDEAAFAALVRRYGRLVLGVCSRVLRDEHAAHDAFQATFMVLARKAASLQKPESLSAWLYGVATRTALKAKAQEARRRAIERRAAVAEAVADSDAQGSHEVRPVLEEAVNALPEKYRVSFVLHYLEGLTVAEVARRLNCPQGTIAARLARAKEKLRSRLTRKGLTVAGMLVAVVSAGAASAPVPPSLAAATVHAAMLVGVGKATAATMAAVLMKGVVEAMAMAKVKVAAAVLVAASALGIGASLSWHDHAGHSPSQGGAASAEAPPTLERVYAGGFHSLRGFQFRSGARTPQTSNGRTIFAPSCKGRVQTDVSEPLHMVRFVDSGTVEGAAFKDYRVTAGFGVRIVVPMLGPVPIALDHDFPIVNSREEREQLFNFWMGFYS